MQQPSDVTPASAVDGEGGDNNAPIPSHAERLAMAKERRRVNYSGPRWVPAWAVCLRYGDISDRTLARWVEKGRLPEPMKLGGRNYFNEAELDAFDAARREPAATTT